MNGSVRFAITLSVLAAFSFFLPLQIAQSKAAPENEQQQSVLVEFFTSEGCSSCPPSDRLAIQLQNGSTGDGKVIVLSEHVDYWNHLGWKDNYSSGQYTNRQGTYAQALHQNSVYTPEAVIDGTYGVVGSDARSISKAIRQCASEPKATLKLSFGEAKDARAESQKRKVTVTTTQYPPNLRDTKAQLYIAVTEDNLKSDVRSGENGGSVLMHGAVVRSMQKMGQPVTIAEHNGLPYVGELTLDPSWKKRDLRVVAFLEDPETQKVLGANQIKMP
ncbi:MAG TPA: DUF1223 domain-containing protein [Oculatellaceae cyanobacterium]